MDDYTKGVIVGCFFATVLIGVMEGIQRCLANSLRRKYPNRRDWDAREFVGIGEYILATRNGPTITQK